MMKKALIWCVIVLVCLLPQCVYSQIEIVEIQKCSFTADTTDHLQSVKKLVKAGDYKLHNLCTADLSQLLNLDSLRALGNQKISLYLLKIKGASELAEINGIIDSLGYQPANLIELMLFAIGCNIDRTRSNSIVALNASRVNNPETVFQITTQPYQMKLAPYNTTANICLFIVVKLE